MIASAHTYYTNKTFVDRTAYEAPVVAARPIDNRTVALSRALIEEQARDAKSIAAAPTDADQSLSHSVEDNRELELRSQLFD